MKEQTEWRSVTTNYGTEEMPDLVRTLEMQRAGRTYRLHIGNTNTWADILDENGKTVSSISYRQGKDCHVYNPDELLENAESFYEAIRTPHAKRNLALLFSQGECASREIDLRRNYSKQARITKFQTEREIELNEFRRKHCAGLDLVNTIQTAEEVC